MRAPNDADADQYHESADGPNRAESARSPVSGPGLSRGASRNCTFPIFHRSRLPTGLQIGYILTLSS